MDKTYTSKWTQERVEAHVYADGSVSVALFDIDGKRYCTNGFESLEHAETWLAHAWGEWDE